MAQHTSDVRTGDSASGPSTLGWAVAGLSTGAAVIHFAMVPVHAGGSLIDPLGFAIAGWFQLFVAAAALTGRAGRRTWLASAVGNLAIAGLWVWSRTAGLPVGEHQGVVEEVGAIDLMAQGLGVAAAILSARLFLAPATGSDRVRLAPAFAAAAAIGLATTVITSPDAASHGGGDESTLSAHEATMALIDEERCDTDFNHPSYWEEADTLGIDTYEGGAMDMSHDDGAAAGDGHGHSHGAAEVAATTTTTEPDPLGGRGSEELDRLVGLTGAAGESEGGAAALVIALAEASEETYDAWLWWLKASGAVGHGHAHDAAPGDSGGHGGHVGPQPWVAMTDQAQCDQLAEELELARSVAMKYDTVAKAEAAGWTKVTGYVPGIASHYMRFEYVDTRFDIEEPEMLLYDGTDPDSAIVGLSYYIVHEGEAEPTQGFTGPNDHFHRHVGLCIRGGVVIGDSQTTAEECAERGGSKAGGDKQWMNHVWVVPGCESPWGVFSAATPVLDGELGRASGSDGGGCAGSSVRDRYGLDRPNGPGELTATDGEENAGTASTSRGPGS
jgi:hypothetical protein